MGCFRSIDPEGSIERGNGKRTHLGSLPPSPSPSSGCKNSRKSSVEGGRELDSRRRSELCRRMVRGLSLGIRGKGGGRRRRRDEEIRGGKVHIESENNKSWLLADTQKEEEEPHSSFRFSFGSQVEAESGNVCSTATVLLVNLEKDGDETEGAVTASLSSSLSQTQFRRHSRRHNTLRLESLERSISPVAGTLIRFSYSEILSATHDFCRGRVLGRGALSCVYRGSLGIGEFRLLGSGGKRKRRTVAVKRLEGQDKECAKAFCRELVVAGSLSHPNVVPLLGFCAHQQGLFLVYKYVSGGSLNHHLHPEEEEDTGNNNRCVGGGGVGDNYPLSWSARFKVAVGIAGAVVYLHQGTDKCILHRDIKPSNILLSSNNTPLLCDFGYATWTHGPSLPFLCKTVRGTFGYLAPEYFQHGKLSDKTDVYAFGVVLLELITGRKPIDTSRPYGDWNLVLWAKPLLEKGSVEELVDSRLRPRSFKWSEMSRMIRAAAACLSNEESKRPSINQVIRMLRGEEEECDDWSVFTGNGCFSGYGAQSLDSRAKGHMTDHLALAMLGVSDTEEDDLFGR